MGLTVRRFFNTAPAAFRFSAKTLQSLIDYLREQGYSDKEVIKWMVHNRQNIEASDTKMKIITARGYNAHEMVRRSPRILGSPVNDIGPKFDIFEGIGMSREAIEADPSMIGQALGALRTRRSYFNRILRFLDMQTTGDEVLARRPSGFRQSMAKLAFVATVAAHYGDPKDRTMTPVSIDQFLATPAEVHMLHIASGNYKRPGSTSPYRGISEAERVKAVDAALAGPETSQYFNEAVIKAYVRYRKSKTKSKK